MCIISLLLCIFFCKQKTAYEMRISDWSSDVCSSDLRFQIPDGAHWVDLRRVPMDVGRAIARATREIERANPRLDGVFGDPQWTNRDRQIGRASCRERVCQYV